MDDKTTADQLINEAATLRNNGQAVPAIEKYQQAASIYSNLGDQNAAAGAWQMIGVSHKMVGESDKAVESLQKAVEIFTQSGNRVGLGNSYRDIGLTYSYVGKTEEAMVWLDKSSVVLGETDAKDELGITQAKIGLVQLQAGNFLEAEEWFASGLTNIRSKGNSFYELTALLNRAELDFGAGNFSQAMTHLWASLGVLQSTGDVNQKRRLSQIYGLLAHCYFELGNTPFAVNYFRKALELLSQMPAEAGGFVYADFKAKELVEKLKVKNPEVLPTLPIPPSLI